MVADIKLSDNSIVLEGAEVQNTGPTAGYAFWDRVKPNEQRWVLYSNQGSARLYADSRGEDVLEVNEAGEVNTDGAFAGYGFRDRTKPNEQRWVLYSNQGNAHLWAESRGRDVVTFNQSGLVACGGPEAGFWFADRDKPAEASGVWYCGNGEAHFEFTGRLPNGTVTERLRIRVNNTTGVTIHTHARVTGDLNVQGVANFGDNVDVDGNLNVRGNVTQASSITLKEDVVSLSGQEALEALDGLSPVTFSYKSDDRHERHIGFIAEDVPDLLASADRDRVSPMDMVALLTKVVKEQQKTISDLTAKVTVLQQTVSQ